MWTGRSNYPAVRPAAVAPRPVPATVNQPQRIEVRLRGQTREAILAAANKMGVMNVRFYAMRNGNGYHGYGFILL